MARFVKKNKRFSNSVKQIGIRNIIILGVFIVFGITLMTKFSPFDSLDDRSRADYDPTTRTFLETFDGAPTSPQPLGGILGQTVLPNWDIQVHSRDSSTWLNLESMEAMHGTDCSAPPATHTNNTYEGAVFNCKNHIMTAIRAEGYGEIVLTPSAMADFSNSPSVIQFEMSTNRMSDRDWPDVWITPFNDNLNLPFSAGDVDQQGAPKNAIHIDAENNQNSWVVSVIKNGVTTDVNNVYATPSMNEGIAPNTNQDATRQTFKLTVSRTHLKLERLASSTAPAVVYVDQDVPDIGFSQGVVQFAHHSYNPTKGDGCGSMCMAATWHWDTISISPAIPFTIIHADKRYVNANNQTVTFTSAAPANSYLRFTGIGLISYSLNGGSTWQTATKQAFVGHYEHMSPYFIPVPTGTQQVMFKFAKDDWYQGPYFAKDFSLWSLTTDTNTTQPSPTPSQTVTPTTIVATNTPTPTLRPTSTPTPTLKPTSTPTPTLKPTSTPTPTLRPTATLTPTPTIQAGMWKAEYFNNKNLSGTPLVTQSDSAINFNWGWGAPSSQIPSDNFSVKWTKQENFEGGTYKFTYTSDDGLMVYVDNTLIINSWKNQSAKAKSINVPVTSGIHTVTILYYENWGAAVAKIYWKKI